MSQKIRVLIVDDSLSIRLLLNGLIHAAPNMEVVGMAENPIKAMELMKTVEADVMTLDVEMPEMDGVSFLKKIMKLKPIPVVMISTLTHKGSSTAMEALAHGAIDVVGKPSAVAGELEKQKDEIIEKIRNASYARVGQKNVPKINMADIQNLSQPNASAGSDSSSAANPISADLSFTTAKSIDDVYPKEKRSKASETEAPAIAIGSSTGGPGVLREIMTEIQTTNHPPIFIAQHMGAGFTEALARSLDGLSALTITEAKDGMPAKNGHAYIAPGNKHLTISKNLKGEYVCKLLDLDRVNRHRPAVDILFRSFGQAVGKNAYAILLTGMGNDGAQCLKELKSLGATTAVQSEETCAVFGMPRVALEMEPTHRTLSPVKISNFIKEIKL